MLAFKPKTSKRIIVAPKSGVTLDAKHKEFVHEFTVDEQDKIPRLIAERDKIMQDRGTEEERKRLQKINHDIAKLRAKKTAYFLDNSKFIFNYFENKKSISVGQESAPQIQLSVPKSNKRDSVMNFFNKKSTSYHEQDASGKGLEIGEEEDNSAGMIVNTPVAAYGASLLQKYLCNVDNTLLNVAQYTRQPDLCTVCGNGELITVDDEGVMVCKNCAHNVPYLIENEKPSYNDPPKEVCFYAYKKINHFKEILAQFQGKETTQIPHEVLRLIRVQIQKERISLTESLTYYKTKELLKKLGYNKLYEHINFIRDKLGIRVPRISQHLEETLCNFFIDLQYPYAKYCPDCRVHFLHYYYVLYKLFELLNETEYLHEIPMLKDREKIIEQDTIWKNICIDLNWKFIQTV